MSLVEMLPIVGALSAPAFFLIFALASLGSPLLAFVCLASGQLQTTQYIEAYARRLLRMALTTALPALLAFIAISALFAIKTPWLLDWLRAAPVGPGLFTMSILAYLASLLTLRKSKPSARHARQSSPLAQALVLSVLSLAILWLTLALMDGILEQAQAVLRATPVLEGLNVAPLVTPDASALPPLFWTSLAALVPLCTAGAGALSMEYLLLRRDSDPFGREALAQMLRVASRSTLRSTLLAAAFLPVLWSHLPEMPDLVDGVLGARILLGLAGACALVLCLCAGLVARSGRPWSRSLTIHLAAFVFWLGLTALLGVALLCFYAA